MQDLSGNPFTASLTPAERAMVQAIVVGETAAVADQPIRACVIRDLVFGRGGLVPVPAYGIRIDGAIIEGSLNLDGAGIDVPLILTNCKIVSCEGEAALSLRDAEIRRLALYDVTLETEIVADRALITGGLIAERIAAPAALHLSHARLGHTLSLRGAVLGTGSHAIIASDLHLDGSLVLNGARLAGTVSLNRAYVGDSITAGQALIGPSRQSLGAVDQAGLGLDLDGVTVGRDVLLDEVGISGCLTAVHGRIGGRLDAIGITVNAVGAGIDLTGLSVGHGLCLDDTRITGALNLTAVRSNKHVSARRLRVDGGEVAIEANRLRVREDLDIAAARLVGQLRCSSAQIGGAMQLGDAKIYSSELALHGEGLRVQRRCTLSRGFFVGAIDLTGSTFADRFELDGATVKVAYGAALRAVNAEFSNDVELGRGLQTIGAVIFDRARVSGVCNFAGSRLRSAAIARMANGTPKTAPPTQDRREDEAVISLVDASLKRLQMPAQINERPRGIIDFTRASVDAYQDWSPAWPPPPAERTRDGQGRDLDHLVLDGFVYERLLNPAGGGERSQVGSQRLSWLDGCASRPVASETAMSERFVAQPWQQLLDCLARQGLERDARSIAIEQQRRLRRTSTTSASARWANRLRDWTTLFGFSPRRTVLWMVATIALFSGIWAVAASHCIRPTCSDQTVFVMTNSDGYTADDPDRHYPAFNSIGFAVDNFVPFARLGYADHWRPNPNFTQLAEITVPHIPVFISGETDPGRIYTKLIITLGTVLYLLTLAEQLLGIVFILLLVSNFTRLLGREK